MITMAVRKQLQPASQPTAAEARQEIEKRQRVVWPLNKTIF